jgi:hypothetical protein
MKNKAMAIKVATTTMQNKNNMKKPWPKHNDCQSVIVITQNEKTMTRPQGARQWIQKLQY